METKHRKLMKFEKSSTGLSIYLVVLGLVIWGTQYFFRKPSGFSSETPQTHEVFGVLVLLIIFLIAFIIFVYGYRKKRRQQFLKENGVRVIGKAVEAKYNESDYLIIVHLKKDGQTYEFRSNNLKDNPLPYLKDNAVIIYHEIGNLENYYVDIEESTAHSEENIIRL